MVGREGEFFSNRVLHYAGSLRGTGQYWFKQRSRLISMVDALGLPTVFITHSAADTQWPKLAKLIYQMTSTAVPAGKLPLQTIQRSWKVFLLTESTSSSMPSTLLFWEQRTNEYDLSGSTVEVHTFMVLPGFPMPQMWNSCWPLKTTLTS